MRAVASAKCMRVLVYLLKTACNLSLQIADAPQCCCSLVFVIGTAYVLLLTVSVNNCSRSIMVLSAAELRGLPQRKLCLAAVS